VPSAMQGSSDDAAEHVRIAAQIVFARHGCNATRFAAVSSPAAACAVAMVVITARQVASEAHAVLFTSHCADVAPTNAATSATFMENMVASECAE
jgi:hypothetical protein